MLNLDYLTSKGVSTEAWKKVFTADSPSEKVEAFRKRAWWRANDGIADGLGDWTIYKAIDAAWDTPLRQITPTLLTSLSGESVVKNDPSGDNILKVFSSLSLTKYLKNEEYTDPKTQKKAMRQVLDVPAFFSIIIPLVKPYVTIRWAKLCNDRHLDPFIKFEPIHNAPEDRIKCSVLTSRVQLMATQFNYPEIQKQSILGMLLYPETYQFIESEWFSEEQYVSNGDKTTKQLVREGLTYHRPHPTRVYRDKAYPGYTLLTDTGCRWVGYWRIKRFCEIEENESFWNRDRVKVGSNWVGNYPAYFNAYASCIMAFPNPAPGQDNDAQSKIAQGYYTSDYKDMGVMVTEHFERFIPKDVGLGDYDCPIWGRFVFAGDGTVIYAAPLPGVPAIYYGDAVDSNRDHNASLALEIIPFQDALSNAMTQAILSSKQNLSGVTWVDTDLVDEKEIQKLENVGEAFYRSRKFMRYSGRKWMRQQSDPDHAMFCTSFPWLDVNGIITTFNIILNLLERVVQISPQEMGGSASHEQSAEEIRYSQQGTSNRLLFSSAAVDRSTDAWKRQIYQYLMAYGEDEIYAQLRVEDLQNITEKELNDLGFTIHRQVRPGEKHVQVTGAKTAIQLEYFSASRDGADRVDDKSIANAMTQVFIGAMQNPMLAQAIGPDQAVSLLNTIIKWLGLPDDFRMKAQAAQGNPEQMQQIMQEVQKAIGESSQAVLKEVQNGLAPLVDALKKTMASSQEAQQMGQQNSITIEKLAQAVEAHATAIQNAPTPTPPEAYDSNSISPLGPEQGGGIPPMAGPAPMPMVQNGA